MKAGDRYDSLFRYYAEMHQLPWRVLKSMAMAESSLNPDAVSKVGAQGLGQFMKATAAWMGVKDPFDPEESIRGMAKYLGSIYWNCVTFLHGEDVTPFFVWRCTASAYNCGWGYVREALHQMKMDDRPMTWDLFSAYLPNVTYRGKKPRAAESLEHGKKVIPLNHPADLFSLA